MKNINAKRITYHHGNLRHVLLQEAAKQIKSSGLRDLSLRKLATKCNVSSMALYRHFPNKTALIIAVLKKGYEILQKDLKDIYQKHSSDNLIDMLKALGYGYFNFAIKNKNFFYLMYSANTFPQCYKKYLDEQANITFVFLKSIVKHGLKNNKLTQTNINTMAFAMWSYIHGIIFLALQGKITNINAELSTKELLDQLMNYMYLGLKLHNTNI